MKLQFYSGQAMKPLENPENYVDLGSECEASDLARRIKSRKETLKAISAHGHDSIHYAAIEGLIAEDRIILNHLLSNTSEGREI